MKAWCGKRETDKCWGNEIKNILTDESVVDDPKTFVSENHGYVTVRHGTDFFSSGCAAAPGEVERVRMAHYYNTKIMPHVEPTVFGGEMIEGHHSNRRRRRSPRKSEWESNSKHVDDMTELSRRKRDSKTTPTPVTKATGKGRRDIDDEVDQHDVRASREVAGTGASSLQFVAFVVHPGETWVFNYQADPKTLYVYTDTDGAAEDLTGKFVSSTVERYGSHILDCSAAEQSRIALAQRETESHGIVRRVAEAASSWRVRVAPPWIRQRWERVAPPELLVDHQEP